MSSSSSSSSGEVYATTGSKKSQKHAVYERWLDGTIAKRPTPITEFMPALHGIARLMGQEESDFTAKGLSQFLASVEGRSSRVVSSVREKKKCWTIAPDGYVTLAAHQIVVDARTYNKYAAFYQKYRHEAAKIDSGSCSSSSSSYPTTTPSSRSLSMSNSSSLSSLSSSSLSSLSSSSSTSTSTSPSTSTSTSMPEGNFGHAARMLSYSRERTSTTTETEEEPEPLPKKGDRPQSYSSAYKYACREFALLSRTSTRKLPHVHLFIVRATLRELRRLGSISSMPDLRDLARIIPMNYANILDFGRRMDD